MVVNLVSSADGDWIAIYVDGVKVDEGHSLSESMVLDAVGIVHGHRELTASEMEAIGHYMPDRLDELPSLK